MGLPASRLSRRSRAAALLGASLAFSLTTSESLAQTGDTKPPSDTSPPPASAPGPGAPPGAPAPTGGSAPIRIGTSDGKGMIYLDDKLVGEGSFVGDIPAGPHALKITRQGFDTFEEQITVKDKEPLSRTVTLKINSTVQTGSAQEIDRLEGLYGGFSFLALFTPGGTQNDVQKLICNNGPADVTSCNAPDGFGGGFGGFIGYHWNPVGIEFFAAGQYDSRTMTVDWKASSTDPGIGPNPQRHEEYTLHRIGGMGLFRARLTLNVGSRFRASFALGAGITRRVMLLQRDTTSVDGKDKDAYVSDAAGYWSPIVNFEPSFMFRITKGVAVNAGLQLFFDTPSSFMSGNPKDTNPQSSKESFHQLGNSGPPLFVPRGLSTNPMDLASNLQVFIGPFVGMMFGP